MPQKINYTQVNDTDYSTNEIDTGAKWIDGKAIYKKSIATGNLPNATQKAISHGITGLSQMISLTGYATNGTVTIPLPHSNPTATSTVALYYNGTSLVIENAGNWLTFSGHITVLYTKV